MKTTFILFLLIILPITTQAAQDSINDLAAKGSEAFAREDYSKAYDLYGKALELDPANAEALAILGLLQALTGSHDICIQSVKNAVTINPAIPQLHTDLAMVLSYAGEHEAALDSINRAIGRHSTPPTAYYGGRARIYFFLGQYDRALADAEREKNEGDIRNFSVFILGALNDRVAAQKIAAIRLQIRPW